MNCRIAIGLAAFLLTITSSAMAQTHDTVRSVRGNESDVEAGAVNSHSHVSCNTGYTEATCRQQLEVLKAALAKYPVKNLGEWSWILNPPGDDRREGTAPGTFTSDVLEKEADSSLMIRILVYNYSKASRGALARAEREAERVFNEAGMDIQWLNCPMGSGAAVLESPCAKVLDENELILRVLAEPARNGFQEDVFGAAVFPVLASVYYEPARRTARSDNAEFEAPIILGNAIAHEVGHLLLGPNAHSTEGIMQPRWERKEIRQAMWRTLSFTGEQASAMRAAARVRTRTVRAKTSANTKSGRSS